MEEKKKEASERISLGLELIFGTLQSLELGFAITKNSSIRIINTQTRLSKTFTPEEFEKTYDQWEKKRL